MKLESKSKITKLQSVSALVGAANIIGLIFLILIQKPQKLFISPNSFSVPVLAKSDIILVQPDGIDDSGDFMYEIIWKDYEQMDGKVSLYYDIDDVGTNGNLIIQNIPAEQPNNNYYWNTASIPDGDYYIYLVYSQGADLVSYYSDGPVTIDHTTICLDISTRINLMPDPSFDEGIQAEIVKSWGSKLWSKVLEFTTTIFSTLLNIIDDEARIPTESEVVSNSTTASSWFVDLPSSSRDRSWGFERVNDPSQAHSGNGSIKIHSTFNGVNSNSAWNDRVSVASPLLDLPTPGGKYILTAWIKTNNVAVGHVVFKSEYFDQDGNELEIKGHESDTFYVGGPQTEIWTQVAFLLNAPHWESPPYSTNALAEMVQISFYLDNSPGTLLVDDISLIEISDEEYEYHNLNNRYAFPTINTATAPTMISNIKGWGTTIQQDPSTGVWWFVAPNQAAFWGIGTNTNYNDKLEELTGLTKYEYKKEAQYRAKMDLSFNLSWREKDINSIYSSTQNDIDWLNFSSEAKIDAPPELWVLKDRDGNLIAKHGHYFADVFSPIWQENAIKEAQTLLSDDGKVIESEQTIGYWTDNEWAYGDLHDFLWGDTIKLAFVDWLQGKNNFPSVDAIFYKMGSSINLDVPVGYEIENPYTATDELNRAWSSDYHRYNYSSFEDIYKEKPYIRAHDDPIADDFFAFERVIYKIYVDTIIDNIRQVETDFITRTGKGYHHAIFSNRFNLKSPSALEALRRNMDIFSRFDVIAVNWYPTNRQGTTHYSREWMEIVKNTFHDTTGRPLFISEFGIAAEDADDYSNVPYLTVARWRKKTVTHEYQRGWTYVNWVSTWANLPYVIGAKWFIWANAYGDSNGSDVRNSGLVDDSDQYYVHLTDNMRSVNQQISILSRSGTFSLQDINWQSVQLNLCDQ